MKYETYVDHTILRSDTTPSEIHKVCSEAINFGFHSVCVPPFYVKTCALLLKDSEVSVATVIGYPMGYSCLKAKQEEISSAIANGANELDVVININAVKSADWEYVRHELNTLVGLVRLNNKTIKVIIEYELCTTEELTSILQMCNESGPDYVKTSTGNNHYVVTAKDVELIRSRLVQSIRIKASGGIRTLEQIRALVEAGANRIGTSSAITIFSE